MNDRFLSEEQIKQFKQHLIKNEKSMATVEKYLRDVRAFSAYLGTEIVSKESVLAYKQHLLGRHYAVRSINSMLASLNSIFHFLNWTDCKVRSIRSQRQVYCTEEQELTKSEYQRLLDASKKSPKLQLIMQTICATGIRVSELKYFTVEEIHHGEIHVDCKGKTRTILIPGKLRKRLIDFAKRSRIRSGPIFLNRFGCPINRSSIWAQMKALCKDAGINPRKVFPHNLRKLFARTFYSIDKDIAKLADILGHSSIETTRIYIITTGSEHRRKMEKLGLVR